MSYTKEEIDQIILSKDLDEFYFAIFEKKRKFKLISDQELKELRGENVKYIGASKEKVDTVYEKAKELDEKSQRNMAETIMKLIYTMSQTRLSAIITMIDNDIYNIATPTGPEKINLDEYKIINYENLTNYYDESTCKIRYVTAEDDPRIKGRIVSLDTTNDNLFYDYANRTVRQKQSKDLTQKFKEEVSKKDSPKTYIKK